MFESLIAQYGYLGIVLGTFLEGEAVLLVAGALAQKGMLSLPLVVACAALGSLTWAELWFHLGRRLGQSALERRPTWRARAAEVERFATRYGAGFVIGFRFVAGMGTAAPALLGASGFPPRRYIGLDVVGALAWALALSATGWGLAAIVVKLLAEAPFYEVAALVVGLGAVLIVLVRRVNRGLRSPRRSVRQAP